MQQQGVSIPRSNKAQRVGVGISEASGVGVESLVQLWVKLDLLRALGSGGGKALWNAIPMVKIKTETNKASPRRLIS